MDHHMLEIKALSSGYDKRVIVNQVDLRIPKEKISVIIGANACGKSTLLKTMARLIKPIEGQVVLDGKSIHQYQTKKLAKTLGLLPQSPLVPEGITVADLVARGRFPYQTFLKGYQASDYRVIEESLEMMGILDLANRHVDELSGGQRQRVWIAMALAQEPDILLLDEPTTYLDISHQVEILDLLTDLNKVKKTTIVMVLHEINLSARYADYIFAMKKGHLIAEGSPKDVLDEKLIKEVFDLDSQIVMDPVSGTPLVLPLGRHHS